MINEQFGFEIPVFVIPQERLRDILLNAPDWWGEMTIKKSMII